MSLENFFLLGHDGEVLPLEMRKNLEKWLGSDLSGELARFDAAKAVSKETVQSVVTSWESAKKKLAPFKQYSALIQSVYQETWSQGRKAEWLESRRVILGILQDWEARGRDLSRAAISISHCRGAVAVFGMEHGGGFGVDVELRGRELSENLVERFLTDEEREELRTHPVLSNPIGAWVAKEACVKALGRDGALMTDVFLRVDRAMDLKDSEIMIYFNVLEINEFCLGLAFTESLA